MRQHYVSPGYLEGFSDPSAGKESGVWTVDDADGSIKPLRVDAVAAIVDYYTVTIYGERDNFIEADFAELEGETTPLLVKLRGGDCSIDEAERAALSEFAATQVVRVPAFREPIERFWVGMTRNLSGLMTQSRDRYARILREALPGRQFTEDEIDSAWESARDPAKYTIKVNPETSLSLALQTIETIAAMVFDMRWQFLVAPEESGFLTTDNPVAWANPDFPGSFYGHGLAASGTELVWPIGKTVTLLATWHGSEGVGNVDADFLEKVNRRVLSTAKRYVFCPSQKLAHWANGTRSKDSGRR